MIVDLTAEPLDIELTEPFGIATGAQHRAANVLVRVVLDDGAIGLGEAAPFPAVSGETQSAALAAIEVAREIVVGARAETWRALALARILPSARAAIESAIVDALCRRSGTPMWRTFGGRSSVLETDITVTTGDAAHARRSAERALADGFGTLKVKVGGVPRSEDVLRLSAIAEAAPSTRLVLDANASFTAEEAIGLCRALGAIGRSVVLFEQPVARDDLDALARVESETGVRVAADESARSAADVERIGVAGAASVVNLKIAKSGLGGALDMVEAARAFGLGLMIGGMVESKLSMGVSAALAAGIGGFELVDLDTPLFMKGAPTVGGWTQVGPRIDLSAIEAGHGVDVVRGGASARTGRSA